METDTGREALLTAFDRLFDRAAAKLNLECTVEERDEAKRAFAERYEAALRLVDEIRMPSIPEPAVARMETAIDDLSPATVAAHLATVPLALHVQEMMRQITARAAEQRVLEHFVQGAEDRYGGN
jgi:hypothetical protein